MSRETGTEAAAHTPRYLLRRRLILEVLRRLPSGSFLEVGCGRGELLPWLKEIGLHGVGLEISDSVLPKARAAAAPLAPAITVASSLDEIGDRPFDYLLSFEVLEHLEDDEEWLSLWLRHLQPNGRLVCSIPAHMKLWSSSDTAVGHVRRYERADLVAMLEGLGLEVEILWSYGYPLVLITRPLRHAFYKIRSRRWSGRQQQQRTLDSSMESTLELSPVFRTLGRAVLELIGWTFHQLGRPLRRTDFGDGYLVVARWR